MYFCGYGVKEDYTEAVKWYRMAAEQGHAGAQYSLGNAYDSGNGVKKDSSEAVKWYRKAAEQGYVFAQEELARKYKYGSGVKRDKKEAAKWQKIAEQTKAKEQEALNKTLNDIKNPNVISYTSAQNTQITEPEDAESQFRLGSEYYNKQNYEEAAKWWRKAGTQGHVKAQFNLGSILSNGKVTPKHDMEAAYWYGEAGKQGNAEAFYNLGLMYSTGKGVQKSNGSAFGFYLKAAQMGHAISQNTIGFAYQYGLLDMTQDYDKAAYWYGKAAEQGLTAAQDNLNKLNQIRYETIQKTANNTNGDFSGQISSSGGNEPPVITKRLRTGKVVTYTPQKTVQTGGSSSSNVTSNQRREIEDHDPCYKCRSSGKIICDRCDGDGGTYEYINNAPNYTGSRRSSSSRVRHQCSKCRGAGKIDCPDCDGKGYLVRRH